MNKFMLLLLVISFNSQASIIGTGSATATNNIPGTFCEVSAEDYKETEKIAKQRADENAREQCGGQSYPVDNYEITSACRVYGTFILITAKAHYQCE